MSDSDHCMTAPSHMTVHSLSGFSVLRFRWKWPSWLFSPRSFLTLLLPVLSFSTFSAILASRFLRLSTDASLPLTVGGSTSLFFSKSSSCSVAVARLVRSVRLTRLVNLLILMLRLKRDPPSVEPGRDFVFLVLTLLPRLDGIPRKLLRDSSSGVEGIDVAAWLSAALPSSAMLLRRPSILDLPRISRLVLLEAVQSTMSVPDSPFGEVGEDDSINTISLSSLPIFLSFSGEYSNESEGCRDMASSYVGGMSEMISSSIGWTW